MKRHIVIAWAGLLVLIALHLDFWRSERTDLYFGWLPEELVYRVAWMVAAWAYLLYFCARVWREDDD